MSRRVRWFVVGLCAALALGCGAGSLWIEAKAVLAQALLERAWSNTAGVRDRVKPWPWADTWPVARLSVPRLDQNWIVLAGASGRTLAFGPGHLDGTPLPGESGNVVLAGHRDTQFATLEALQLGDVLLVETPARKIARFLVSDLEIVDQRELGRVTAPGEDGLTLVTCWPFGALVPGGTLRYVVRAAPVIDEPIRPQHMAIRG